MHSDFEGRPAEPKEGFDLESYFHRCLLVFCARGFYATAWVVFLLNRLSEGTVNTWLQGVTMSRWMHPWRTGNFWRLCTYEDLQSLLASSSWWAFATMNCIHVFELRRITSHSQTHVHRVIVLYPVRTFVFFTAVCALANRPTWSPSPKSQMPKA